MWFGLEHSKHFCTPFVRYGEYSGRQSCCSCKTTCAEGIAYWSFVQLLTIMSFLAIATITYSIIFIEYNFGNVYSHGKK